MHPTDEKFLTFVKDLLNNKRESDKSELKLLYDIWKAYEYGTIFKMFMGTQHGQLKGLLLDDKSMGGLKRGKYYELILHYMYGNITQIKDACADSKDAKAKEQSQYPYIPLHAPSFSALLDYISKKYKHRKSFIDVGCGIGDKVLFAFLSRLFDECHGIEYDIISYKIAAQTTGWEMSNHIKSDKESKRYGNGNSFFIKGDAFDHDYSKYDTAYLYCPMSDGKMMKKLIGHIHTTQKSGSIICLFLDNFGVKRWAESKGIKIEYEKKSGAIIIHK
jgi:hypothetical protein